MIVKEFVSSTGATVQIADDACRNATPEELERRRNVTRDTAKKNLIEKAKREYYATEPSA